MAEKTLRMRVKFWIEVDGENAFGMGSFALLQGVETTGSLAGAAKEIGMSYRTAWGRIRKIEERMGQPVLVKRGGNKSGYQLSAFGARCLASYKAAYAAVHTVAQREFDHRFASLLADQPDKTGDDEAGDEAGQDETTQQAGGQAVADNCPARKP